MKSNKLKILKWIFIITFLLIIFLIIVPLCINYSYQRGLDKSYIKTFFSVNEIFSFYGASLSFIGTITLGALALWQNKKLNDVNNKLHDYQRRQKIGLLFPKKYPPNHEFGRINPIMPASCDSFYISNGEPVGEDKCHISMQNRGNDIIHDYNCIYTCINHKSHCNTVDSEMLIEVDETIKFDYDFEEINKNNVQKINIVTLMSMKNSVGLNYYQILTIFLSRSENTKTQFNIIGYNSKVCFCLLEAEDVYNTWSKKAS